MPGKERNVRGEMSASKRLLAVAIGIALLLAVVELALQAAAVVLRIGQSSASAELAPDADSGDYTVLCLGESTTAAYFGVPAYSSLLSKLLNRRYETSFRVVNAGFPAVSTSVLLEKLPGLIEEHQPDMVVLMMGINDSFYFSDWDRLGVNMDLQLFLLKFRTYRLARLFAQHFRAEPAASAAKIDQEALKRFQALADGAIRMRFFTPSGQAQEEQPAYSEADWERDLRALVDGALEAARFAGGEADRVPEPYRFYHRGAVEKLQDIYRNSGRHEEAIALLERAIAGKTDAPALRHALIRLYDETGRGERAQEHKRAMDELAGRSVLAITRSNYRAAVEMLRARGTRVVAMQYPMRSARILRHMLDDRDDVIFVDNERHFKEAVRGAGYDAIFRDRAGGDFGHLTPRGIEILAAHLLETVFHPLFGNR